MTARSACMPSTPWAAAKAGSSKSKWSIQARGSMAQLEGLIDWCRRFEGPEARRTVCQPGHLTRPLEPKRQGIVRRLLRKGGTDHSSPGNGNAVTAASILIPSGQRTRLLAGAFRRHDLDQRRKDHGAVPAQWCA